MTKIIIYLVVLFNGVLFAQVEIPVLTQWATDYTNTLSEQELSYLNRDLKQYSDSTSNQIVFLMISTLDGYPLETFSYETAEKNKIGTKANNGVFFLVVKNDRLTRIEVGYGLEGALTDAVTNSIQRNIVRPLFKENQYFDGIRAGIDTIKVASAGEYKAEPQKNRNKKKFFGPIFIILLIIALNFFFRMGRRGGMVFYGGGFGSGRGWGGSSGGFGGGFGGGGGGFRGGGGSFGGGGSSGSW